MIIRYAVLILGLMASGSFQMMRGEAHQKYLRTTDPADLKVMRRISQLELLELKAELRGIERCPVCRWYAPRAHKRMQELKDSLVAFDDALANPEKPEEKHEKKRVSRSRSRSKSAQRDVKKAVLPEPIEVDQELGQESRESFEESKPERRVLRSRSKSWVRLEEAKKVLPEQNELEQEPEEESVKEKVQEKQTPKRVTRSRSPERAFSQLPRAYNHGHPCDPQRPKIINGMIDGVPWDFWPYTVSSGKPSEDEALLRERWKKNELPKCYLERGLEMLKNSFDTLLWKDHVSDEDTV